MTKNDLLVVIIAIIFLLFANEFKENSIYIEFVDSNISIPAEIADTTFLRERGLMFRENLQGGMLFVFDEPKILRFWMKNMIIPLDIIFVSEEMAIINIIENAQPCANCKIYSSAVPAKYAVEVNAGFAEKHGIEVGNRIMVE